MIDLYKNKIKKPLVEQSLELGTSDYNTCLFHLVQTIHFLYKLPINLNSILLGKTIIAMESQAFIDGNSSNFYN